MLPAFREPTGFLDLVVGFGPTYLPMEWLYAMAITTPRGWDRDWLLARLQAAVPTTNGRRVAWSLNVEQHYWWDADESVGHSYVIKLTDSLVRHQLRDEAVTNVRRLFIDVQFELAAPSSLVLGTSPGLTPGQLAHSHLGGPPPAVGVSPQGFIVDAPAFRTVSSSIHMAPEPVAAP